MLRVSDIFEQKLNEIQSRVPLKINKPTTSSFRDILSNAVNNSVFANNTNTVNNISTANTFNLNNFDAKTQL